MSNWIQHDGTGMPVPPDTLVECKHRDGVNLKGFDPARYWDEHNNWLRSRFSRSCWIHDGSGDDIVAYRLVDK